MPTRDPPSIDPLHAADASSSDDFHLGDLMTVDQAVEHFPIFTRLELLAAMRAGDLRHWPKGRQRFTTERWLQDWIGSQLRGGEDDAGRKVSQADTPDPSPRVGPPYRPLTPDEEEVVAGLLAQSILRKPRKPARRSR